MVEELGIADVPVYDSPTSTPSTGAIFRQSSVRKRFVPQMSQLSGIHQPWLLTYSLYLLFSTVKKAEDLKRDAEHRIGTLPKARRNIYQPFGSSI